jgi:hypothetical protein
VCSRGLAGIGTSMAHVKAPAGPAVVASLLIAAPAAVWTRDGFVRTRIP